MKRLADIYEIGDGVEIQWQGEDGPIWQIGVVIRRDFPGIWVRTGDGMEWFVTNSRRIRPRRTNAS